MSPIIGIFSSAVSIASGSFESIASASGTGAAATITFSSIPGTYQHLQLRGITKSTNNTAGRINVDLTLNGDTSSVYASHRLYGNGASALAEGTASAAAIRLNNFGLTNGASIASMHGAFIVDIHDYASTSKNKTVRAFYGNDANIANTYAQVSLSSGLWASTAAVTSLTFTVLANNWTTTTQFALYGIKA